MDLIDKYIFHTSFIVKHWRENLMKTFPLRQTLESGICDVLSGSVTHKRTIFIESLHDTSDAQKDHIHHVYT